MVQKTENGCMPKIDNSQKVISYNTANAAAWEKQMQDLTGRLVRMTAVREEDEKNRVLLKKQAQSLEEKIAQRKSVIEAKVEAAHKPQKRLDASSIISTLKNELKAIEHELKLDILEEIEIQLKDVTKEIFDPMVSYYKRVKEKDVDVPLHLLDEKIHAEDAQINAVKSEGQQLHKWASETNIFLRNWQNAPETLVQKFKNKVLLLKSNHEEKFPDQQTDMVRICLNEFEDKIKTIVVGPKFLGEREGLLDGKPDPNVSRQQYFDIAGLLWKMYSSFKALKSLPEADLELANAIFAVLQEMHIDKNDEMPDEAISHKPEKSCIGNYSASAKYKDLGMREVKANEEKKYADVLKQLNNTLQDPFVTPVLKLACDVVIAEVDKQKKASTHNVSFCTNILTATHQLVRPGGDTPPNFERYMSLANHASGKPSGWKAVAGAMLVLGGLFLISVSLAAIVLSYGSSTPVSLLGLKFGAGLLAAGFTSGAAGFTVGCYSFFSGVRHGLSKNMVACKDAVQKHVPDDANKTIEMSTAANKVVRSSVCLPGGAPLFVSTDCSPTPRIAPEPSAPPITPGKQVA